MDVGDKRSLICFLADFKIQSLYVSNSGNGINYISYNLYNIKRNLTEISEEMFINTDGSVPTNI